MKDKSSRRTWIERKEGRRNKRKVMRNFIRDEIHRERKDKKVEEKKIKKSMQEGNRKDKNEGRHRKIMEYNRTEYRRNVRE